MTWPIPPLAATRTNDTPQFDTHPADHNAIAAAINELRVRHMTVNLYSAFTSTTITLTNVLQTVASVAMPAAPASSILDITGIMYLSTQVVGSAGSYCRVFVNGVAQNPMAFGPDLVALGSYSTRVLTAPPVGIPYTITLQCAKLAAGGTAKVDYPHTGLVVISYRPPSSFALDDEDVAVLDPAGVGDP